MGADNVDIFKKIVFSLPDLKYQIAAMLVLSPVYAGLTYLAFDLFAPLNLYPLLIPISALLVYLLPSLIAAELFYQVLPDYPRNWSYFLSLTNQLILFVYSLILSGADNIGNAWSVVWLAIITICLVNILVLIMSIGIEWIKRILILSFTQSVTLLLFFHFFLGRSLQISTISYVFNIASLITAALFLVVILKIVDYLIGSNTNVSAFELTSGLLKNERESLDLGYDSRPDVQTLEIDNGDTLSLAAPWVHPGPLGGFGGGELSDRIIERLNKENQGFFLHVPCTHKEDLADPNDAEKIIDALKNPEKSSQASELIAKEYEDVKFYGRRLGDQKIVYLDTEGIDDYDVGIFMKDISRDDVLLVDLHNHDIHEGPEKEVQYGTLEAENLKSAFDDFLKQLDDVEQYDYHAGFEVFECDHSFMAMVEEVNGQETLIFGIDTNGVTEDLRDLRESYEDRFDEVLLFSTDTHASVYDLANMNSSDIPQVRKAVELARSRVSKAQAGFANQKSESLSLLKLDYNGLMFSINILIRLVIIALVFFYLLLVLWIF